jgi:hypothetical protein
MVINCIRLVDDQFYVVGSLDGIKVEIPISSRIADLLRSIGVPFCQRKRPNLQDR